jgi:hypothetical protein
MFPSVSSSRQFFADDRTNHEHNTNHLRFGDFTVRFRFGRIRDMSAAEGQRVARRFFAGAFRVTKRFLFFLEFSFDFFPRNHRFLPVLGDGCFSFLAHETNEKFYKRKILPPFRVFRVFRGHPLTNIATHFLRQRAQLLAGFLADLNPGIAPAISLVRQQVGNKPAYPYHVSRAEGFVQEI